MDFACRCAARGLHGGLAPPASRRPVAWHRSGKPGFEFKRPGDSKRAAHWSILLTASRGIGALVPTRARPVPTPQQLQWQCDKLALFLHFGVNTFTDRGWGDGTENPSVFQPTTLDARQWAH